MRPEHRTAGLFGETLGGFRLPKLNNWDSPEKFRCHKYYPLNCTFWKNVDQQIRPQSVRLMTPFGNSRCLCWKKLQLIFYWYFEGNSVHAKSKLAAVVPQYCRLNIFQIYFISSFGCDLDINIWSWYIAKRSGYRESCRQWMMRAKSLLGGRGAKYQLSEVDQAGYEQNGQRGRNGRKFNWAS